MKYYYENSLREVLNEVENRKIILYGTNSLAKTIYYNLKHMNQEIEYFVDEQCRIEEIDGKKVKNLYDLLYEKKNDIFIIAYAIENHGRIYNNLIGMKFEFEKDFCIYGLGGYIRKFDAIDSLLGFTRQYDKLLGFEVYGDLNNSKALKIMTLGGSTSDPSMGNYKSWPELLYEKISKECDVIIFSGGMGGYGVNQELLKFLRDGLAIMPDILITFDGYNDVGFQVTAIGYPLLHRYQDKFFSFVEKHHPMAPDTLDMRNPEKILHGVANNQMSDSTNWINTIRKIHALANEFGIEYYSFLQPMILSGNAVLDKSVSQLAEEYLSANVRVKEAYETIPQYVRECQKKAEKHNYISDLTHVFDGIEDVYYDICHSTEKGNRIIMENIYRTIEDKIKEHSE